MKTDKYIIRTKETQYRQIMSETKILDIQLLEFNKGQIEGLPKNPRMIRDARFDALKKSIQDAPEMLNLRELIVYPLGGKYVTICGNMRLKACKELNYLSLPCKILETDTPQEKLREYAIKDNIAFGDDDWGSLAGEWDTEELLDWGVELPDESEINPEDFGTDFNLPNGEKSNIETVSLMMSKEQAEIVKNAIKDAQGLEEYKYLETFGNENKSGNAVYLIVRQWADARK